MRTCLLGWVWLVLVGTAVAGEPGFSLLGKAQPDEFYHGLGGDYYPLGQQPPGLVGQPKVNQSYLWAMTKTDQDVWFGTAANPVAAAFGGIAGFPIPIETQTNVFEYWQSRYPGISFLLRPFLGDWRPPEIYRLSATGELRNVTPNHPLIRDTLGIRSAGATDDVVLMSGPSLWQIGINVFAFDAATGDFLGAQRILEFSNIRRWLRVDGTLYTATLDTWTLSGSGSVVRWRGSRTNPFAYDIVGQLDNEGATLCAHDGRLYALTWSTLSRTIELITGARSRNPAGVWMSPQLTATGLTTNDRNRWSKVWHVREYEPDPLIWRSVWMGAAASHDGHLVWGTLQIPGTGAQTLRDAYGWPDDLGVLIPAIRNSFRPAALFRGRVDSVGRFQTELLYGSANLPVYTRTGSAGTWADVANGIGPPKLGDAGFGNPFNMYVWSMLAHQGRLWIGTFDMSFILFGDNYVRGVQVPDGLGADLAVMDRSDAPVTMVSQTGCGNVANNGVREMLSDGNRILIGTATSANLLTDPNDHLADGGWELLSFHPNNVRLGPTTSAPAKSIQPDWRQVWPRLGQMLP